MKSKSWFEKTTIWDVAGAALAFGAGVMLIRQLPSAARYLRMINIAKPHSKAQPKGLLFEGDPTNAQAPRRALDSHWDPKPAGNSVKTQLLPTR